MALITFGLNVTGCLTCEGKKAIVGDVVHITVDLTKHPDFANNPIKATIRGISDPMKFQAPDNTIKTGRRYSLEADDLFFPAGLATLNECDVSQILCPNCCDAAELDYSNYNVRLTTAETELDAVEGRLDVLEPNVGTLQTDVASLNSRTVNLEWAVAALKVPNVAALAGLSGISDGDYVQTRGYYVESDSGGNFYQYVAGSSAVCDGGIVLDGIGGDNSPAATVASYPGIGTGRFIAVDQRTANALQYGCKADNATDDSFRVQAVFNSTKKLLYFPEGAYSIENSINVDAAQRTTVLGAGLQTVFNFNPTVNDDALFVSVNNDNVIFRDFQINFSNANTVAGATAFDMANANVSALTFERVYVEGFESYGLKLDSAQYLKVKDCRFINNRSATASQAHAIYCTTFLNAAYITGCRFADNDKAIRIVDGKGVTIDHCSFESEGRTSTVNGVATLDYNVEISSPRGGFKFGPGNYVEGCETAAGRGFLAIEDGVSPIIEGNFFAGDSGGVTYMDSAIFLFGSAGRETLIINNAFEEVKQYFVNGSGYAAVIRLRGNTFIDTGAPVATYAAIMAMINLNNPELSDGPAHEEAGVDIPSLAAGGGFWESGSYAVAKTELGDKIDVALGVYQDAVQVQAYVVSPGNVRISAVNHGASPVDLVSTTAYLTVCKTKAN